MIGNSFGYGDRGLNRYTKCDLFSSDREVDSGALLLCNFQAKNIPETPPHSSLGAGADEEDIGLYWTWVECQLPATTYPLEQARSTCRIQPSTVSILYVKQNLVRLPYRRPDLVREQQIPR